MSTPPLFAALVDDAGLFPPERLPMAAAVERHRVDAAAAHPVLTHRFLCPASRIDPLRATLDEAEPFRLGLIVDTHLAGMARALATVAGDERLTLETLEVPLPVGDVVAAAKVLVPDLAGLHADVFVELPRAPGWVEAMDVVAAAGLGAKVRCGGVRPELFPTAAELAAFLRAAVERGLSCKATAGLHHAVRYRDPATGHRHHGFLNLLLAAARATRRETDDAVAAVLESDDAVALADEARALPAAVATRTRTHLVAYGSCSTSEPIADLTALELI